MKRLFGLLVLTVLIAATAPRMAAQLLNKEAPIIVGHYFLNVSSIDEHKKFWVDLLGGTPTKIGRYDVIKFPDIYIVLNQQKPTGPTKGTSFDHIGFSAPSVPAVVEKLTKAGYQLTEGRIGAAGPNAGAGGGRQAAPPAAPGATPGGAPAAGGAQPGAAPRAGGAGGGRGGAGPAIAYPVGPDGLKLEIVTNREAGAPPLKHHHVHFINTKYVEMQQWYIKALDATARTGANTFTDYFAGADLPGVGYMLNFFRWEGDQSLKFEPTKGRVMDHVGFEVKNLEQFVKGLEGKGIKLTQPYRKDPAMGNIGSAFITDPFGVLIQLTEGLRDLP